MSRVLPVVLLCLLPSFAEAVQVQINWRFPFAYIQIGHGRFSNFGLFGAPTNQIDEVTFNFPAGVTPGDGTNVVGTPVIPIALLGYNGGNRSRWTVTMNSSLPLTNANGDTISFNEISWTTRDGDIPSGRFNQGASQTLMNFNVPWRRGRGVIDYLTFEFDNDTVYTAGSYQGRVVYTIALL